MPIERSNLDFLPAANITRWNKTSTVDKYLSGSYEFSGYGKRKEREKKVIVIGRYQIQEPSSLYVEPVYITLNVNKEQITLPFKLKHVAEAISEAMHILTFQNDWDDNGAEATDIETFKKAITFLTNYSIDVLKFGVIDKPFIDILRDGSISIFWETSKATLLIVFRKGNYELSYFFGEEKQKKVPFKYAIKNENEIDEIVSIWMSKYLI